MVEKAFCQLVQLFSSPETDSNDELFDRCYASNESRNVYGNVQTFSEHFKTTKRFQKSFYYGNLRQCNLHSPLALTDATLKFFNNRLPNTCRLDILDLDYAASVSRTVCISPYSLVLAMMYLEQLRHKNPDHLENVSPCDLFIVSVLVASKYLFDNGEEFTYNCDWAEAANLEVQDLNRLEKEFLHAMNWELFTAPSDYFAFLSKVEQWVAYKQSKHRGWFSYTELLILSHSKILNSDFWADVSSAIVKTVLVLTFSYAAAVAILYSTITVAYVSHSFIRSLIDGVPLNCSSVLKSNELCCKSLYARNVEQIMVLNYQQPILEPANLQSCISQNKTIQQDAQPKMTKYPFNSKKSQTCRYSSVELLWKNNVNRKKQAEFPFPLLFDLSKPKIETPDNCHSVVINNDFNLSHSQV